MVNFRGSRFVLYSLSAVVLFGLTTQYMDFPFFQPVWQNLAIFDVQKSMARYLVRSKLLIGKSRQEVIDLLKVGAKYQALVPGPQDMQVMSIPVHATEWSLLHLYFRGDRVVDAGI